MYLTDLAAGMGFGGFLGRSKASANASESFAVSAEAEVSLEVIASVDAPASMASSCALCNSSLICFFSCSVDIASTAALSTTEPPSEKFPLQYDYLLK